MTPGRRRTLLLTLAAIAGAAILILALSDVVTLEHVKARREQLLALIAAHPIAFTSLFLIAFALLASFAPGAAVLKVAAGALFGLWGGFAVAQLATLMAATLGFVGARYLGREAVERRFQRPVAIVNRGVEREGVTFLLALRFNPLIPFFLINFALGLTRMRLSVFAATSFFGLIPASFVYANAGTEIARIEAPSDILSVRLLGSLILLSLMPLAGRWAAQKLRSRRGPIADLPGDV